MKCLIIAAGPELEEKHLLEEMKENPFVICADGGYDHAKRLNIVPNLLLGDFDSVKEDGVTTKQNVETIVYPCEKDDTDTVAAVKEAVKRGFDEVVLYGATGGRLDHTMGNLGCLGYLFNKGKRGRIVYPFGTIELIGGRVKIYAERGKTISLIPFDKTAKGVTLKGFYYPLNEATVLHEHPIGISNVVVEDEAEIVIKEGSLLLFINW